ncbi:MAG: phosphoserine phosphatase RsbX [Massilia sp.]|jgi:hypothetical protein
MQVAMNLGYAVRPFQRGACCGDMGDSWRLPQRRVLALADGLGQGPEAERAAAAAMQCVGDYVDLDCEDIFAACNGRLRDTRGVALAVAIIDRATDRLTVGAIDNIRVVLLTSERKVRLGGGRGIVGAGYSSFPVDTVSLAHGDTLVMFTDGVNEMADLRSCLADSGATMQAFAQTILTRWSRENDDAGVLVYRHDVW